MTSRKEEKVGRKENGILGDRGIGYDREIKLIEDERGKNVGK